MTKKSFTESIKDDFKPVTLAEKASKGARTKAVPGARLIPLTEIEPDQNQPRKSFNRDSFDELTESIKRKGVIEPLTVIRSNDGYQLVVCERRFRAAKSAGLEAVPCIVKDIPENEILEYQLIENLQRENLSPVEEAKAFKKMTDNGRKQAEIARLIGKSQPYISQSLKILNLDESILEKALRESTPKDVLLKMLEKPKKAKSGRPKIKPWTWKPENKEFTVAIKFRKNDYGNDELINALEQLLAELRNA